MATTTKRCPKCCQNLPISDFGRDQAKKDGLYGLCRACKNLGQRTKYPTCRTDYRLRHLKRTYGLANDAFDAMLAAQGNRCVICQTHLTPEASRVDHCHTTGRVRAILCNTCNATLGMARENPDLLRAIAAYAERHRTD